MLIVRARSASSTTGGRLKDTFGLRSGCQTWKGGHPLFSRYPKQFVVWWRTASSLLHPRAECRLAEFVSWKMDDPGGTVPSWREAAPMMMISSLLTVTLRGKPLLCALETMSCLGG